MMSWQKRDTIDSFRYARRLLDDWFLRYGRWEAERLTRNLVARLSGGNTHDRAVIKALLTAWGG
jgi:hypothetical protein